ncbi:hypothetical protein DJ56_4186 [Yersinia pestis]|nr:hypothetical protein DJ56_4186 [Yersinia pestis]
MALAPLAISSNDVWPKAPFAPRINSPAVTVVVPS